MSRGDAVHKGRRQRLNATAQVRMRDRAGMPELRDDASTCGMHRLRDATPAAHQLRDPEPRRISPTEGRRADRCGFRDNQAGRSALRVVLGLKFGRYMVSRACPHAGQRRHHNAVGQIEIAHAYRREMSVNSLTRFMKSIISIPDDSSISKLCIALPGTS